MPRTLLVLACSY